MIGSTPDVDVAIVGSGPYGLSIAAHLAAVGVDHRILGPPMRASDAFVIQSHAAPISEWIMEQLIMVDALKRASAKRITVVMPFYGYARQDRKHRGREPISGRLMADLFKTAGANRQMAVDLHTAQIQRFFDGPVEHCGRAASAGRLRRRALRDRTVVRGVPGRRSHPGRGDVE